MFSFKSYSSPAQRNEISFIVGAMHNIAFRTSDDKVGRVSFKRPITKTIGLVFDKKIYNKFYIEIGGQIDDYDLGYDMSYYSPNTNGLEISAGKLGLGWRLLTYKLLTCLQYQLIEKNNFQINTISGLSLSYFKSNKHFDDTSYNVGGPVTYKTLPAKQRNGLTILPILGIEGKQKLINKFHITFRLSYQFGITQFFQDETHIWIKDNPSSGFTTAKTYINGSTIQGHLGIGYRF